MIRLETPRLILRPFTWEDLDELARISADPENRRYMWAGPLTREQTAENIREWMAEYERGLGTLAVIHKPDGRLIGQCGIGLEDGDSVGVGYMLDHPYWGMGLATEAAAALIRYGLEKTGAERVCAAGMAENGASRRLMERLGMSHERTEHHEAGDEVFYSGTREEFTKSRSEDRVRGTAR